MKRTILTLLAISASAVAFAGNDAPGNCGNGSGGGNACLPDSGNSKSASKSSSKSRSASASNATSASIAAGGTATAKGGEGGTASTGAISNANSSTGGANSLTLNEGSLRASANQANAPTIFPTANCTVASSFGVQGMSFGIAGGAATIDASCETIEQAKAAQALGQSDVAREVLCSLPRIREARKHSGSPCFADTAAGAQAAKADEPTDPYIRARIGLPPQQ